jgi:hypothetical protein
VRPAQADGASGSGSGGRDASALSWEGRFARNAQNFLDVDVLVVDEASMLDLPLSAALLSALPPSACLLIVGDADQLPPVGPGAVLRDALRSGALPAARLSAVFRQADGSLIIRAAHAVNDGRFPPLAPVSLAPPGDGSDGTAPLAPLPWDAFAEGFAPQVVRTVPALDALAPPASLDALWVRLPEHRAGDSSGSMHGGGSGSDSDAEDADGGAAAHEDAALAALRQLITHTLPAAGFDPRKDLQARARVRKCSRLCVTRC